MIDQRILTKALEQLRPITSTKAEIAGQIRIMAAGGRLSLAATNLDETASVSVPCDDDAEIAAIVRASELSAAAKALGPCTLDLERTGGTLAVSARGGASVTIPCADWDALPAADWVTEYLEAPNGLAEAVAAVAYAASHDSTRPQLCGVHVSADGQRVQCVATDGHRLAMATVPSGLKIDGCTLSHSAAAMLGRLDGLRIAVRGDGVSAIAMQGRAGGVEVEVVARCVDGVYPDFERVIPARDKPGAVVLDCCAELASHVSAALTLGCAGIWLEGQGDSMTVGGRSQDLGRQYKATMDYSGNKFWRVGVNPAYLGPALAGAETVMVTDDLSPLRVDGRHGEISLVSIVMPVRL